MLAISIAARPTTWADGVVAALGTGVPVPVAVVAQALPPKAAQTAKDIVQSLFFMSVVFSMWETNFAARLKWKTCLAKIDMTA